MISVVIPSYNRRDCVVRLLHDLSCQRAVQFEIIVVDDASTDDTVQSVQTDFPEVTLLINEKNSGPCVARNNGILAARGHIIVGLDSDVTISDPLLLKKVEQAFDKSPEASGFAFRIFAPDGQTDDAPRWWHPIPLEHGKEKTFETDYFSGTAYAFYKKEMINADLYPSILYMHYEEVELAYRILDQGGTIFYNPQLTAVHHENKVAKRSRVQLFYKPRNQILMAASCFPLRKAIIYLIPRFSYQLLKATCRLHLHTFIAALYSALKILPQRLKSNTPLKKGTLLRIEKLHQL